MISFESDYNQGAHERILARLCETNMERVVSYGFDKYTESAKEKIRKACECPDADIYFLTGGTQTNAVAIDSMLDRYQSVIATETGHINLHEAGAIEHSGHKVVTLPHHEGKLMAADVEKYLCDFYADGNREHLAQPGMVYISHPTEYGTLYTKAELSALAELCGKYNIPLYMDGARLGYGLMSRRTDVTLPDIARLCDIFYIGGTKVGALCGEALVFTKKNIPPHFMTSIKLHGALMAKGRLNGIQFDTLFTDGLYFEISKSAIDKAERLRSIFESNGYRIFIDSPTNQQFVILENGQMERLSAHVGFSFWEKYDDNHTVVRFATSWATTDEDMDILEKILIENV